MMTIDRVALIALTAAGLAFGAYRAGFAADIGTGDHVAINKIVSGGAADGVSFLWLVDEVDRRVVICAAHVGQAPTCNANAAALP